MTIDRSGNFFEDPAQAIFDYGNGAEGSLFVGQGSVFRMEGTTRGATSQIGQFPGGDGSVVVSGAGSRIELTGAGNPDDIPGVQVGRSGGIGRLSVTNNGTYSITETAPGVGAYLNVGRDEGSDGGVRVASGGSLEIRTAHGAHVHVGREGAFGNFVVEQNGRALVSSTGTDQSTHVEVGRGRSDTGQRGEGELRVASGSELDIESARDAWLIVGVQGGDGRVVFDSSAEVTIAGGRNAGLRVGSRFSGDEGGSGQVTLQNGARLDIAGVENADLNIGGIEGSSGEVRVLSGSVVDLGTTGNLRVGWPQPDTTGGGEARLVIDGTGSAVQGLRFAHIGRDGGRGEVTVSDTGWLRFGSFDMASGVNIDLGGGSGSDGRLAIDAGLVSLQAGNGGFTPYVAVGRDGGTGRVEITRNPDIGLGQGLFVNGGGTSDWAGFDIGIGNGGDGTVTLDGGFLWLQNVGRSFGPRGSGEVVDLPGDGGRASLQLGFDGGTGRLDATNGAEINNFGTFATRTAVGVGNGTGEFLLDDSSFVNRSEAGQAGLELGEWGDGNGLMRLRNGAEATIEGQGDAYANIGRFAGSTGELRLESESTFMLTSPEGGAFMPVGWNDARGIVTLDGGSTLRLESGGDDHSAQLDIGRDSAEGGSVAIRSGSLLQIDAARFANLLVGSEAGTGTLLVDAARVEMTGNDTNIRVGTRWSETPDSTGDGTLTLQNGAELDMAPQGGFGGLRAGGDGGTGRVEVMSGARMTMGGSEMLIGVAHQEQTPGGLGTLMVDGDGSRVSEARGLAVGGNGATGTAAVTAGARLLLGGTDLDNWSWLEVGRGTGSDGTLTINRAMVSQQGANGLRPDSDEGWTPYTVIGRDGGTGRMEVVGDRGTDPDASHGYIQIGGANADFSTVDIGRGEGADGTVTVRGAFFGAQNDGTSFGIEPPFDPVDLPGPGGGAVLRIGIQGATGRLTAEENSEIFVQSGDAGNAALVIGAAGGDGTAALAGGVLDVLSAGQRGIIGIGLDPDSMGSLTLDGTVATVRGGGGDPQVPGRDVLLIAGFDQGTGNILLTGGATLELRAQDDAQFAMVDLGDGGTGSLRIEGDGSRVTLNGPETRVDMAAGEAGGTAMLEIADGGLLELTGDIIAGTPEAGEGARSIMLDGGSLAADAVNLASATLMGAGTLTDRDTGNGFLTLSDSVLSVGEVMRDGESVRGQGDLRVTGEVDMTDSALRFAKLPGAGPDQLLIEGGLSMAGGSVSVEWLGDPPGTEPAEYLLARATGGIDLDGTALTTTLPDGAGVTFETRADGTELWLLSGGPATVTVSGSIAPRSGLLPEGGTVTFTPDDGEAVSAAIAADGSFSLELDSGSTGRLDATLDTMPSLSTGSALNVLRMAVGLEPAWGPAGPLEFIAADFGRTGAVTTGDALQILRVAVGLSAANAPEWVFVDEGALDELSRTNVAYDAGVALADLTADVTGLSLSAVLIGDLTAAT